MLPRASASEFERKELGQNADLSGRLVHVSLCTPTIRRELSFVYLRLKLQASWPELRVLEMSCPC